MTLNNSNIFEIDGIHLFIWEPNLIVLPIPNNCLDSYTSIEIRLHFINNTPNPFYLSPDKTLILEISAPDGEALQAEVVPDDTNIELNTTPQESWGFQLRRLIFNLTHFTKYNETSKPDPRLIEPSRGINITFTIKLFWLDNKLQLQFINDYTDLQTLFGINKYWSFNKLLHKAYTFRFIWSNFNSKSYSQLQAEREIKATEFVNLHLIEPVGNNGNAIEVEGICFETFLPETTLILQKKKRGVKTSIQLGIRIKNNTLVPAHFSFFATLIPQLIQSSGQQLKGYRYYRHWNRRLASDFKLVMPRECITFFPYASIFRVRRKEFILQIETGDGGFWNFEIVQTGNYQIQFIYNNKYVSEEVYDRETKSRNLIDGLWMGMVCTPKIDIEIKK